MATVQQHVETVLRVIHSGSPNTGSNGNTDLIHRSWRRCATEHALDPAMRPDVRIETNSRLRECRQQLEEHLHVARAGMEQLYKHVSDLGYVLLLTDAEGVTLDFIGNDTWDAPLRRAGLALGANWNEIHAGTNGIGTCIAEQSTVICDREDHFYIGHIGLSCTSTPLYDPDGAFMGALDVSALSSPDRRESLHLARHLTVLHARMIEDANFIRQFRAHWILRLGTVGPLVDVCGELMLAVDRDGRIVGANSGARQQLRLLDSLHTRDAARAQLVGNHLTGVFGTRIDDIWRLTKGTSHDSRGVVTTWDGQGYHASMIAPKTAPRLQVQEAGDTPRNPVPDSVLSRLSGGDPRMDQLLERAARLVDKPVSIFLQGETGTGKEVLARALHDASRRAERPFVAVNCAAIPESLIESELFGYAPGTFTGARSKGMKGLIQRSDGGTLFLDEIGDMPLPLQTRLLRVLAEREVLPLGADEPVRVDLNVVAASHRDLRRQIVAGTFREDLYYRLCGATLALPALRERGDKAFLIERILAMEAQAMGVRAEIEPRAVAVLLRHDWPGNIRELRNALCYALSIADGATVRVDHLPQEVFEADGAAVPETATVIPFPREPVAGTDERGELLEVLRRNRWNISEAARDLGACRATVYRRMKRLDIVSPTQTD
ncbi:sigma-54-dependent Fis family transcriptional regulator [Pseudoxanthomonas japonensis]|uniref:sigma-54-dependent Fis family transcriptional regulator n=1 Tax=Pseudoxanthomonas japonensis TaxID=69284 RepID=UPI001BD16406|nr:sigma-54-dependent Fis family transcriptional regulator [Pseudoxanthomonas japonensis]